MSDKYSNASRNAWTRRNLMVAMAWKWVRQNRPDIEKLIRVEAYRQIPLQRRETPLPIALKNRK